MTEEVRFQLRHPEASKAAPRISQSKYDLVKAAIVEVVEEDGLGVPFAELADRVAATLPRRISRRLARSDGTPRQSSSISRLVV